MTKPIIIENEAKLAIRGADGGEFLIELNYDESTERHILTVSAIEGGQVANSAEVSCAS